MQRDTTNPCIGTLSQEHEAVLHARGVLVMPDFIANAGGVICAAVEYRGGTQRSTFDTIGDKIAANSDAVLDLVRQGGMLPRRAAVQLAQSRMRRAMGYRRWSSRAAAP